MISLHDLRLDVGSFHLEVDELTIAPGEYFVLLGPTGAGKTLLLETIAGLRSPQSGVIRLGAQEITFWPPERREVGLVCQDSLVFPHLSVAQNIAFGLRSENAHRRAVRVKELAVLFRIESLLARAPNGLSGGERQRVSLARALAAKPHILLLDEPLSSVDADTRASLWEELVFLNRSLGQTVFHVTHDQIEAMALANRLGVLLDGHLTQVGPPLEVWRKPQAVAVAHFLGSRNIFPGRAVRREGSTQVRLIDGLELLAQSAGEGQVTVVVRPEDMQIQNQEPTGPNAFPCTVEQLDDVGLLVQARVRAGPLWTVSLTRQRVVELQLQVGSLAFIQVVPEAVHLCRI